MAHSAAAYRSFFPTFVTRWWAEAVIGVEKVRQVTLCSEIRAEAVIGVEKVSHSPPVNL